MALVRLAEFGDGAVVVFGDVAGDELMGLEVTNGTGRDVVVRLGRDMITLSGPAPRLVLPARQRRPVTEGRERGRVDGLGDLSISWG